MARYLFSRTDNHQIGRGGLTDREIQNLRRSWDPISVVEDGIPYGKKMESTQFNFNPRWGAEIGTPARDNDLWRHPNTGLPFTVNPRFYLIEVPTILSKSATSALVLEEGADDPVRQGQTLQRKARRLQPISFTVAQLAELEATHRLRLTIAEFSVVISVRIPIP